MPYDLISFIVILVLIILSSNVIVGHLSKRRLMKWGRITILLSSTIIISTITIVGHSELSRQIQTKHLISSLDSSTNVSLKSDKEAVANLLSSSEPREIRLIEEENISGIGSDKVFKEDIDVNGKGYTIIVICYISPLPWTVFETYQVNQINSKN